MTRNISFARAPLVEIVAELRWLPTGVGMPPQGPVVLGFAAGDGDGLAMAIRGRPEIASFAQTEKLLPPGFPAAWHQVVWRFRNPTVSGVLLQVGPGIFTANAFQPYRRWSEFRPTVRCGVTALLEARPSSEKELQFSALTLRYINAFSTDLIGDMGAEKFVREILGFEVALPGALEALRGPTGSSSLSLNLLLSAANTSKSVLVQVGDGSIRQIGTNADTSVVMLDMSVSENVPQKPDLETVLASFDSSRNIIHDAFLQMTSKIRDRMEPLPESCDA